jgi:Leucine-rich repeat (LRR) protein
LGGNKLSSLSAKTFDGLDNLQELSLNNNHLSSVEANAFDRLPELRQLRLHENRLSTSPKLSPEASKIEIISLYKNDADLKSYVHSGRLPWWWLNKNDELVSSNLSEFLDTPQAYTPITQVYEMSSAQPISAYYALSKEAEDASVINVDKQEAVPNTESSILKEYSSSQVDAPTIESSSLPKEDDNDDFTKVEAPAKVKSRGNSLTVESSLGKEVKPLQANDADEKEKG